MAINIYVYVLLIFFIVQILCLRDETLIVLMYGLFSYWPCYMPLVLIITSDGCNGPRQLALLQPSEATINAKGM